MPLSLFFGLVVVERWGFRQLSNAKAELMSLDLPRVDYGRSSNGGVSKGDVVAWEREMALMGDSDVGGSVIDLSKYSIGG